MYTNSERMKFRLVKPDIEFMQSYIDLVHAFQENNEALVPFVLKENFQDFPAMIDRLNQYSKGIGIEDTFVPHTTYWLVNQSERLLGVINLRLQLTDRLKQIGGNIGFGIKPGERGKGYAKLILKFGLLKLKKAGLDHALVTCDKSNFASRAVIEANRGVLESEAVFEDHNDVVLRFKIEL